MEYILAAPSVGQDRSKSTVWEIAKNVIVVQVVVSLDVASGVVNVATAAVTDHAGPSACQVVKIDVGADADQVVDIVVVVNVNVVAVVDIDIFLSFISLFTISEFLGNSSVPPFTSGC